MPLYHFDSGSRQNPIGRADHWRRFEAFQGSNLHRAFEREIRAIVQQTRIGKTIDSRDVTKSILTDLQATNPELFIEWNDGLAGLFGMTMWNVIARESEDWYCHFIDSEPGEFRGVWYWRDH